MVGPFGISDGEGIVDRLTVGQRHNAEDARGVFARAINLQARSSESEILLEGFHRIYGVRRGSSMT